MYREQINVGYLGYWAQDLGITDLWDAVWRGIRPFPPDDTPEQLSLF